jgi:predicted RNA-binding Zn-ribbon protein involved in translation (DUF1610 family)
MPTRWVCDFCGYEGAAPGDVPPDQVQCPMCGEPVTPLPSRSETGARHWSRSTRVAAAG